MSEQAKIKIVVPQGCTKQSLSIDALDQRTRDLAYQTFIYIDEDQLLCRSFKVTEKGGKKVLTLEIMADCFEIVEGQ